MCFLWVVIFDSKICILNKVRRGMYPKWPIQKRERSFLITAHATQQYLVSDAVIKKWWPLYETFYPYLRTLHLYGQAYLGESHFIGRIKPRLPNFRAIARKALKICDFGELLAFQNQSTRAELNLSALGPANGFKICRRTCCEEFIN